MKFTLIDMETWNRKEHFDCISKMDPSLINITANIDITSLKKFLSENSLKLYPCIIACISNVVNTHNEFKQAYNDKFQLGTYDIIHPSYTIFHKDDLTFSCIYSEYTKDIKDRVIDFEIVDRIIKLLEGKFTILQDKDIVKIELSISFDKTNKKAKVLF